MRKRADETAVPMNEETPFHVDNVAETEMDLVSTQHDTAVPDFDPMQEPAWNRPMSEATTSTCTSGYVQDPTFLAIDSPGSPVAYIHLFASTALATPSSFETGLAAPAYTFTTQLAPPNYASSTTINPVIITTPSPANNGQLQLWDPSASVTSAKSQAIVEIAKAQATGANIHEAYDAAMLSVVSCFVKVSNNIEITVEEVLAFFPNYLQILTVVTRLLNVGWRRGTMARKIPEPRGLSTSDKALCNTENRLQAQLEVEWNFDHGVNNLSMNNVKTNTVALPIDTTEIFLVLSHIHCAPDSASFFAGFVIAESYNAFVLQFLHRHDST